MDKISIPKANRFTKLEPHKPGPGDYHIPSSFGKINNFSKERKIGKN